MRNSEFLPSFIILSKQVIATPQDILYKKYIVVDMINVLLKLTDAVNFKRLR